MEKPMGRRKPNKPGRPRPEPVSHDHGAGFDHDERQFAGHPVNGGLLAELMGASLDGCTSCQDPLLTLLVEDPTTTVRLVSLACVAIHGAFGGLPKGLLDPEDSDAMASPEFRLIARAGVDMDDATDSEMWKVASAMDSTGRRAAANSALDLLAGML
jgi:hypothetical protein